MGLMLLATHCRMYWGWILLAGTPQHAWGRSVGSALGGPDFGREKKIEFCHPNVPDLGGLAQILDKFVHRFTKIWVFKIGPYRHSLCVVTRLQTVVPFFWDTTT